MIHDIQYSIEDDSFGRDSKKQRYHLLFNFDRTRSVIVYWISNAEGSMQMQHKAGDLVISVSTLIRSAFILTLIKMELQRRVFF